MLQNAEGVDISFANAQNTKALTFHLHDCPRALLHRDPNVLLPRRGPRVHLPRVLLPRHVCVYKM